VDSACGNETGRVDFSGGPERPRNQRWQAIPTQLVIAEFEQLVGPHLSSGSRGPPAELVLRKVQRFLSTHDQIANVFSRRPNQDTATSFHTARTQAFITWAEITGVVMAASSRRSTAATQPVVSSAIPSTTSWRCPIYHFGVAPSGIRSTLKSCPTIDASTDRAKLREAGQILKRFIP